MREIAGEYLFLPFCGYLTLPCNPNGILKVTCICSSDGIYLVTENIKKVNTAVPWASRRKAFLHLQSSGGRSLSPCIKRWWETRKYRASFLYIFWIKWDISITEFARDRSFDFQHLLLCVCRCESLKVESLY